MPDEPRIKKRSRRGSGSVFQKVVGGAWHIQYYRPNPETGKSECVKEYIKSHTRTDAQRKLNERLSQISRGEQFEVGRRTTVGMLYEALLNFTKNNSTKPRAVEGAGWRWEHLKHFFAHIPAANVTTALIEKYRSERLEDGAARATINHEVGTLRRMYRYGKQSTPPTVHQVPHFPMFPLDNARQGFVEDDQFRRMAEEATKEGLWLRLLLEMAYTVGWRRGELIKLCVKQVDLRKGVLRLDPGTTKNKKGREAAVTTALEMLLREAVGGKKPEDPLFTRDDGKPVKDFRGAWRNMCVRAGVGEYRCASCDSPWQPIKEFGRQHCPCGSRKRKYEGRILHDFRRSAARNLRKAGVPENVIMAIGGWKTRSMFDRYAIVNNDDTRRAMQALEQARAAAVAVNPLNDPSQEKPTSENAVKEVSTIQ